MMKSKSKKQEDEGSTQSNASRYEPYTFLPFFRFCFDCLRCQAWLIICVRYATWFWRRALVSWMTLLLFNSHTLIFFSPPYHFLHSILRFQACVMDLCPQDACVRPLGKPFLLYYSAKKLVTDVLMSVRYNVIWPCLGVSTALHHF